MPNRLYYSKFKVLLGVGVSLDLNKVAPQIEGMAKKLSRGSEERRRHCAAAISLLHRERDNVEALRRKIEKEVVPVKIPSVE